MLVRPPTIVGDLFVLLVGQLLLLTIRRRLVVHQHDIIQGNLDMRHQLIRFGVDGVAVVQLLCGGGNQTLVTPALLVAAFGGTCDPAELDVFLAACDALGCFSDDLITQGGPDAPV